MYINEYTILGMLSKNYTCDTDNMLIYKKKDKSKVISFDANYHDSTLSEINYAYITNKPKNIKGVYTSNEVVSCFPNTYFSDLKLYSKEIYETRNKWNKKIVVKKTLDNIQDVLDMLDRWVQLSGKKYRFTRHDGYDRNFFINYYEKHKDTFDCNFFYLDNKLVGYSVMSPKIKDTYYYVIRKVDISAGRNICEYVDYKTFENLNDSGFYVNWGASSGGVLKYKTTKFPLYSQETRYFWKVKNEI